MSLAGFYKKIDRPIEAVAFEQGGTFFTTFANAPEATLVGAEIEVQKYVPLDGFSAADFFAARRLVLIGNYTFTDSEISVGPNDTTIPVGTGGMPVPASNLFTDGSRLTGQSRHLANLQIGLENIDRLSQQTIMLTYAMELKFEARNLLGENYEEYQTLNGSRIDTNTYDLGRVFTLGLGVTF